MFQNKKIVQNICSNSTSNYEWIKYELDLYNMFGKAIAKPSFSKKKNTYFYELRCLSEF